MPSLRRFAARARESLKEGWRELLVRSSGALTHFASDRAANGGASAQWSLLAADTWETAHSVVIQVEIPGLSERDLAVDVDAQMLRIRGEKPLVDARQNRRFHLMERAYGYFERRVPLPDTVQAGKAEVTYRDGVLTVILPKSEPLPPH